MLLFFLVVVFFAVVFVAAAFFAVVFFAGAFAAVFLGSWLFCSFFQLSLLFTSAGFSATFNLSLFLPLLFVFCFLDAFFLHFTALAMLAFTY